MSAPVLPWRPEAVGALAVRGPATSHCQSWGPESWRGVRAARYEIQVD
ncbi:hypothetical protein [Streptomyces sp. Root1310]|nr:hypothetical protein [Streptomyces sp. Root1310]